MTGTLHHAYYDKIYSTKDYRAEAETVLVLAEQLLGRPVARLLDVGCGTGNHALHFAERGLQVVGVDRDRDAIAVAEKKAAARGAGVPNFVAGEVGDVAAGSFDCATALFNVVNYVEDVASLLTFFKGVNERLVPGGAFVFDCWNGVAALRDPPRNQDRRIVVDGEIIEVSMRSEMDALRQTIRIGNQVSVTPTAGQPLSFSFDYLHTLWTPKVLQDLLETTGFEVTHLSAWMQPDVPAMVETWKLMFASRKGA